MELITNNNRPSGLWSKVQIVNTTTSININIDINKILVKVTNGMSLSTILNH